MRARFFERVNGKILGPVVVSGGLYHNGKREGLILDAATETDLITLLKAEKERRLNSIDQSVVSLIYNGLWEIRIYGYETILDP